MTRQLGWQSRKPPSIWAGSVTNLAIPSGSCVILIAITTFALICGAWSMTDELLSAALPKTHSWDTVIFYIISLLQYNRLLLPLGALIGSAVMVAVLSSIFLVFYTGKLLASTDIFVSIMGLVMRMVLAVFDTRTRLRNLLLRSLDVYGDKYVSLLTHIRRLPQALQELPDGLALGTVNKIKFAFALMSWQELLVSIVAAVWVIISFTPEFFTPGTPWPLIDVAAWAFMQLDFIVGGEQIWWAVQQIVTVTSLTAFGVGLVMQWCRRRQDLLLTAALRRDPNAVPPEFAPWPGDIPEVLQDKNLRLSAALRAADTAEPSIWERMKIPQPTLMEASYFIGVAHGMLQNILRTRGNLLPSAPLTPPPPGASAYRPAALLDWMLWLSSLLHRTYSDWRVVAVAVAVAWLCAWQLAKRKRKAWLDAFRSHRFEAVCSLSMMPNAPRVSEDNIAQLAHAITERKYGPCPTGTGSRLMMILDLILRFGMAMLWGSMIVGWVNYQGYLPAYAMPAFTNRNSSTDFLLMTGDLALGGSRPDLLQAARINLLAVRAWRWNGLDGVQVAMESLRAASVTRLLSMKSGSDTWNSAYLSWIGMVADVHTASLDGGWITLLPVGGAWGLGQPWERRSALGTDRSLLVAFNGTDSDFFGGGFKSYKSPAPEEVVEEDDGYGDDDDDDDEEEVEEELDEMGLSRDSFCTNACGTDTSDLARALCSKYCYEDADGEFDDPWLFDAAAAQCAESTRASSSRKPDKRSEPSGSRSVRSKSKEDSPYRTASRQPSKTAEKPEPRTGQSTGKATASSARKTDKSSGDASGQRSTGSAGGARDSKTKKSTSSTSGQPTKASAPTASRSGKSSSATTGQSSKRSADSASWPSAAGQSGKASTATSSSKSKSRSGSESRSAKSNKGPSFSAGRADNKLSSSASEYGKAADPPPQNIGSWSNPLDFAPAAAINMGLAGALVLWLVLAGPDWLKSPEKFFNMVVFKVLGLRSGHGKTKAEAASNRKKQRAAEVEKPAGKKARSPPKQPQQKAPKQAKQEQQQKQQQTAKVAASAPPASSLSTSLSPSSSIGTCSAAPVNAQRNPAGSARSANGSVTVKPQGPAPVDKRMPTAAGAAAKGSNPKRQTGDKAMSFDAVANVAAMTASPPAVDSAPSQLPAAAKAANGTVPSRKKLTPADAVPTTTVGPHGETESSDAQGVDQRLAAATSALEAALPFTGTLARKSKPITDTDVASFSEPIVEMPTPVASPAAGATPIAPPAAAAGGAGAAAPTATVVNMMSPASTNATISSAAAAFRSFMMPSATATAPVVPMVATAVAPAGSMAAKPAASATAPGSPRGAVSYAAVAQVPCARAAPPVAASVAPASTPVLDASQDDELPVPIPVSIGKKAQVSAPQPIGLQSPATPPAATVAPQAPTFGLNPALAMYLNRASNHAAARQAPPSPQPAADATPSGAPAAAAAASPRGGAQNTLFDTICIQCRKEPRSVIYFHGSMCHMCYCYGCGASARDGDPCPHCGEPARVLRLKRPAA